MTENIHKAIIYASCRHNGQKRKGTEIPYITHPMEVMAILIENNCPEKVVIAGILHDVLEDTCKNDSERMNARDEIVAMFGKEVLQIVDGMSEDKSLSWKERKAATIEDLKTCSMEIQAVCCADKLANIMSIYEDKKEIGEKIFDRFNAPKNEIEWYYKGVAGGLCRVSGFKMLDQLNEYIKKTFCETSAENVQ